MAETIRVAAELNSLEVNAGEAGDTVITVQNLSAAVGVFTIDLEGLDPAWYSLSSNSVSLFPGDSTNATLVIMPPRLSTALAKDYPFVIKVSSQRDEEDVETLPFTLKVNPFYDFVMDYQPQRARGASAEHTLSLSNNGNADLTFDLEGRDTDGLCTFQFVPETPLVAPGEATQVAVTAKGKRPLRGMPALYQYEVTATPSNAEVVAQSSFGQLEVPPRIPGWAVRAVTLTVIAVVIGVGVYYALSQFLWAPLEIATLEVKPSNLSLTVGQPRQLEAVAKDSEKTLLPDQTVVWDSNNPSVAFVSANGEVRAVKQGTAEISVKFQDRNFDSSKTTIAPALVTVLPPVLSTDCIRYEPKLIRFGVSEDSRLVITDGSNEVLTLTEGDDQTNAIALASRHDGRCFIGRDAPVTERAVAEIEFWIGDYDSTFDEVSPEDCDKAYSRDDAAIRDTAAGWKLTIGSILEIVMDDQDDANDALQFVKRYSSRCYISQTSVEGSQDSYLTQYWK